MYQMKKGGSAKSKKPKMKEGGSLDVNIRAGAMKKTKTKERSADGNYIKKTVTRETPGGNISTSTKTRRTIQGIVEGAPRVDKFKKGGSFPDLTGDGKVTKADVLKGRGVFKKGGSTKMKMGGSCGTPKSLKKK